MSISEINSKVAEAVTLQEAGDYAGAVVKVRSALLLLAALPDSRQQDAELRWKPEGLQHLLTHLQRLATAAVGIGKTPIEYTRPDIETDYR